MTATPAQPPGQELLEGLFERLFRDPDFASQLERDPEQALRDYGLELDERQVSELHRVRGEQLRTEEAAVAALPAVLVAVRVYTSPAVQVAIRSVVALEEQQRLAREFEERG